MKYLNSDNFVFSADIEGYIDENCTLIIYAKHKGLNIICGLFKYTIDPDSKDLNHFIKFLSSIEKEYNIEELTRINDIGLIFNTIEQRY